jgi:hypothetical protein
MAYAAGNPIMSDAEFDELKLRLKVRLLLLPSPSERFYHFNTVPQTQAKGPPLVASIPFRKILSF